MTGALSSVMQRMAQIDARFGRPPTPQLVGQPTAAGAIPAIASDAVATTPGATAPDFRSLFEQTAADGATLLPAPRATPIAQPIDALIDQLAAAGMLPLIPQRPVGTAPSVGVDHGHPSPGTAAPGGVAALSSAATVPSGTPFAAEFESAGVRHGVPAGLLAAVGWVESRYQTDVVSPDGAIGVMQIMPMTARELGVDPRNPVAAIDGAARLLADHQRRFGSWDLALAAYHSGAGAVSRAGNQAPPRGAAYVQRVHDRLEAL